jgi:hypothetical protein
MKKFYIIIFGLFLTHQTYGQGSKDEKMSHQDSILLRSFWTEFKSAIISNDKNKLAKLCEFPFYCSPCTNDTTLKDNDQVTIKVTEKLFYESQYKVFFDKPIRKEVEKQITFDVHLFRSTLDDRNKPNGFMYPYAIISPSNKWEGSQGFIYLRKIDGNYKVTGIDAVP